MDEYFPPRGPGVRGNTATPNHVRPLLDFLQGVTDEAARQGQSVPPQFQQQWNRDFLAWQERLSAYKRKTDDVIARGQGDAFPQPWGPEVMLPLLLGWFPGAKVQVPLDAATPLSLSHQAEVTAAALEIAWSQLGDDLADRAQVFAGPFGTAAAIIAGRPVRWGVVAAWSVGIATVAGVALAVRARLAAPPRGAK